MKRSFRKVVLRDLKKNASRFIAIIAIMFLGVAVLIGLLSCTPVLEYSVDQYYKENSTYDINIKSTVGFDDVDIELLLNEYSNIDKIEAYYQMDLEGKYLNQDITVRKIINTFDNQINKVNLIEGRLPSKYNECVVLKFGSFFDGFDIDSKIYIDDEVYTVVGMVESSVYFYRISEVATAGDGDLEAIIYLDNNYNEFDVYTDIVMTINGALDFSCFDDKYLDFIKLTTKKLENDSSVFISNRIDRLKEAAFDEAMVIASDELKTKITEELNKYNITGSMFDTLFNKYYEEQMVVVTEEVRKTIDEEFSDIEGSWYVLDRDSNISFTTYKVNAKKVDQIGVVFPVFFFFIAALISLTSMTRMVSEERMNIGTLKSLGYSRVSILFKYLFTAFIACLIGSLTGVVAGVYVLPAVIYIAFKAIYVMPTAIYLWNLDVILVSALSMTLTILIVTTMVCVSVLNEKPNALLIPKAPKSGKKILLERITFIWKRLKFKYKSSIRNVFRFKRNLIMMVVGIGGTTGLLIVGFGIDNSIGKLPEDQFEKILKYDAYVESSDLDSIKNLYSDSIILEVESHLAYPILNEDYKSNLYYTDDKILQYMNLGVSFNEDSVIVSKQLAITFDLTKGSLFSVKINDEVKELIVTDVFENYVNNYIIVHKSMSNGDNNALLIKYGNNDKLNESDIIKSIFECENIGSVEILSQTRSIYKSLSDSMDMIIFVLIFASGALAVIVIYNLTNINIDERIREIATLKVLGYQNSEVCGYIYREIIIMSFFGILLGLLIGPPLNYFVLSHLDNIGLCCKTSVESISLVYSILITVFFVILVLFMFIPKIKKVHMVESLKSVE